VASAEGWQRKDDPRTDTNAARKGILIRAAFVCVRGSFLWPPVHAGFLLCSVFRYYFLALSSLTCFSRLSISACTPALKSGLPSFVTEFLRAINLATVKA